MRTKPRAVFIDRDGVINKDNGNYVTNADGFEMLPGVTRGLKKLEEAGYLLIVITNQGGIARNFYSHSDLEIIHQKMKEQFASGGVFLTDIFYCPHYPQFGKCLCRKPGSLMIEKALHRYDIDREHSFMIGDAERDMQAAAAAGVKGIRIATNSDWGHAIAEIVR